MLPFFRRFLRKLKETMVIVFCLLDDCVYQHGGRSDDGRYEEAGAHGDPVGILLQPLPHKIPGYRRGNQKGNP